MPSCGYSHRRQLCHGFQPPSPSPQLATAKSSSQRFRRLLVPTQRYIADLGAILGSKSDGSVKRMREVACPICTVHLQVQVPSSGSETIKFGVCQHPFLLMVANDLD
ncbi:hypothetical protein Q3G72_001027 [Acer saccharum]|nr:hypothetical protein Q3G72_001027 [Acer saccharum]